MPPALRLNMVLTMLTAEEANELVQHPELFKLPEVAGRLDRTLRLGPDFAQLHKVQPPASTRGQDRAR